MIRRIASIVTLLALAGCASSPTPDDDAAPTILRQFGVLESWPGVWKLAPPADTADDDTPRRPVSGTLRIFPVLAGTFLETTLVYRLDDGLPQLARQFWSHEPTTDGYRVWTFADGGAHYDGVLRPTDVDGQIAGVVGGIDAAGEPLRGTLTVTTTRNRIGMTFALESSEGEDTTTVEFVR